MMVGQAFRPAAGLLPGARHVTNFLGGFPLALRILQVMKTATIRSLSLTVFLTAIATCQPQSSNVAQVADGGAWQTILVLTNTTITAATATVTFYQDTAGGATQTWNLSTLEGSTQSVSIPAGSAVFLHTPGTNPVTVTGWAQIIAPGGIVSYAIFTQRVPGRPDQDGTAPGGATASRILVPFDNTAGFTTSVAVVNPTGSDVTISVNLQIENGGVSQSSLLLPANGHSAFALPQQFPATSGHRGLAEFYTTSVRGIGSSFSIIALRFNPTGGFTTAPVFTQSGTPVVGVTPPPPGGGSK
jgi:hypothetical protein